VESTFKVEPFAAMNISISIDKFGHTNLFSQRGWLIDTAPVVLTSAALILGLVANAVVPGWDVE
jgi:hypothetical protein